MPEPADGRVPEGPDGPSMLDLIRLSPRRLFPPGGRDLYRQIALLTDMASGTDVLVVGSGSGVTLEYFVREYGVNGFGVDFDPSMVEQAVTSARERGLMERLHYQHGPSDNLPFRDATFDVVVAEIGLASRSDAGAAVTELVRVAKPGGRLALVQLVWKAPVDGARQEVLSEHLGARPLMLVEWKRHLVAAGVEDLRTEDWSDEETAFRPQVKKPFPDFAELFSIREKLAILRRAWVRWGWKGVRTAIERELEVHRLLTRERILGLDLITGRKVAAPSAASEEGTGGDGAATETEPVGGGAEADGVAGSPAPGSGPEPRTEGPDVPSVANRPPAGAGRKEDDGGDGSDDRSTQGLPLFARTREDA